MKSKYTKAETNMILCPTRDSKCTPERCKTCGWLQDEIRKELQEHGDEPQWENDG